MSNDTELDEMKRLNLADYAASKGYVINKHKTSKTALCYDHPDGDRIVIGTDAKSGHSVYYSVRDETDNGTIIDFIQRRQGLNLGQTRRELRAWREGRQGAEHQPRPTPTTKDRAEQARGLAACEPVTDGHAYLEGRGISNRTLGYFSGRVFTDTRGNAIFPHYDGKGVTGLEIKNSAFTGFSRGGEKGLWFKGQQGAGEIVFCESAIDCMSYHQLKGAEGVAYVSTAGKTNEAQRASLRRLIEANPEAELIAAFDNDEAGERFTAELEEIAQRPVTRDAPTLKDWNDQLQHEQQKQAAMPKPKRAAEAEFEL